MRVGNGTATRIAYFKFAVTGLTGSVTKATLKVYDVTGGTGFSVRDVPSDTWSETTLNWNNKPAYSSIVTSSVGSFAVNTWVSIDVTPLVSGDGTYSFALTSSATTPMDFTAKEYGAAYAPELVVTTGAPPPPPPPPPSGNPPVVSGVNVSSVGLFSATVKWTTDVPATSAVEYGTAASYGVWSPVDSTGTTSHSVTLTDLNFADTYHFRVLSRNSAGVTASSDAAFTTSALPATGRKTSISSSKEFLVDGHPFFPIMQWLQCGSLLSTNAALGVNVFMGNSCSGTSNTSYLDQARAVNALGIVEYDGTVKRIPRSPAGAASTSRTRSRTIPPTSSESSTPTAPTTRTTSTS